MRPEFLSSQRYSLVLVVGCQWDLHPGVLSFFRVFFQFLTWSTLSHIPTVLFHLLSSPSAPFGFLCIFFSWNFWKRKTECISGLAFEQSSKFPADDCPSSGSPAGIPSKTDQKMSFRGPLATFLLHLGGFIPSHLTFVCSPSSALSSPIHSHTLQGDGASSAAQREVGSVPCCQPRPSTAPFHRGGSFLMRIDSFLLVYMCSCFCVQSLPLSGQASRFCFWDPGLDWISRAPTIVSLLSCSYGFNVNWQQLLQTGWIS